jgi:molybdopterin/thiamine biosynthesis adenylyltransferase
MTTPADGTSTDNEATPPPQGFSERDAFARNIGLLREDEQAVLATRCVAIPGLGGVGGIHAITLARLGIGRFRLADPDRFELANFNRQIGATLRTVGQPKIEVTAEWLATINPEAEVACYPEGIDTRNIGAFLDGADVVIDGLDFFALDARRLIFGEAARRGLYVITAGPIGFSCAMLVFDPNGMSFDDYFAIRDDQDESEQRLRFALGLTPRATQLAYMDMTKVNLRDGRGPSLALATNLCAGMAATEVTRILLKRGVPRCAPHYFQFDPYRWIYKRGYMPLGNRNPIQRAKLWYLRRKLL